MLLFLCCFNCVLWNMLYLWYAIHKQLLPPFSINYIIYTTIQYQLYHIYHHSVPTKGLIRYAGLYHHDNSTTTIIKHGKNDLETHKIFNETSYFYFHCTARMSFFIILPIHRKIYLVSPIELVTKISFFDRGCAYVFMKKGLVPRVYL